MDDTEVRANRYIPPGTPVRLDNVVNCEDDSVHSEYGVVVHCWFEEEIDGWDCYITFFGKKPPTTGKPDELPYVLRYSAQSLEVLGPAPAVWP